MIWQIRITFVVISSAEQVIMIWQLVECLAFCQKIGVQYFGF
jgi:hypothetical protein